MRFLYLNVLSGVVFSILMILKFELNILTGSFLIFPICGLISAYFWERHKLKNINRNIIYPISKNELAYIIGIVVLNLVAYLILWLQPTLQFSSWLEALLVAGPLFVFYVVLIEDYRTFGRIIAQNRFNES